MGEKFYITTPIYYASGKPHLGHAFTVVYADVISRWKRSQRSDVLFSAGLDEHGSKIEERAKKENKSPQDFVDEIYQNYLKAWAVLGISYDEFIRTTSERHKKSVLEFIKKIFDNSDIYEDFYEGLYCAECEDFVLKRNLINGLCPDHLILPQKIKEKNFFFNLKKYTPAVEEKIESGEIKITPESRRNEALMMIKSGIPNFSITRGGAKWGIPFPYGSPRGGEQTIYVWADALVNYLSILDYPDGERFKIFWPADVHIIGAEINKFHSVFWPAMLLSADLPLPKEIFIHGLFTVNGQKMSKTLGNVIDPLDLVGKFSADAVRYLALSQFPAGEHGDVKAETFAEKYNSDLANGVGNLFERTFSMILDYRGGIIDEKAGVDEKITRQAEDVSQDYNDHMKNFQLFEALASCFSFIKTLDGYINEKQPWTLNKKNDPELDKVLAVLFFGINKIILLLEPFMPSKMKEARDHIAKMKAGKLKKGEKLGLFPRTG